MKVMKSSPNENNLLCGSQVSANYSRRVQVARKSEICIGVAFEAEGLGCSGLMCVNRPVSSVVQRTVVELGSMFS